MRLFLRPRRPVHGDAPILMPQKRLAKIRPAPRWRPRLEALEDRSVPAGGALDPTFGNGAGYVATSVSTYASGASAVLIQPDGKIIAAGDAGLGTADAAPPDVFAVVRYQADGSLDTSFGTGGHAFADFPGAAFHGWRYSIAHAAALYPQAGTTNDGKIVLAGEHDTKYGAIFALARFNANGTLDSTFGNEKKNPGEVTTTFSTTGDPYQEAFGVVIQTDGKIVAGGTTSDGAFVLARYKTNGALDQTFGAGGEIITEFSGGVLSAAHCSRSRTGNCSWWGRRILLPRRGSWRWSATTPTAAWTHRLEAAAWSPVRWPSTTAASRPHSTRREPPTPVKLPSSDKRRGNQAATWRSPALPPMGP